MSLADFLSDRYLTKDDKKKKKSKKPENIGDAPELHQDDDDDDDKIPEPKHAGWKRVGEPNARPKPPVQEKPVETKPVEKTNETIYRDATGRRVDLKKQMQDAARKEEEEAKDKARLKRQVNMGQVQQKQARRREQELKELETESYAVTADDEKRNEEQKERQLFDDPALLFDSGIKKKSKKRSRKHDIHEKEEQEETYQGNWPANRFNIPPGPRWDGVDRSNGFEQKWFRAHTN